MEKNFKITNTFYFDFYRNKLNINHETDDYYEYEIVTKEKAKEIIEFLTKFVEGE